jgi:ankyrin repeat protein
MNRWLLSKKFIKPTFMAWPFVNAFWSIFAVVLSTVLLSGPSWAETEEKIQNRKSGNIDLHNALAVLSNGANPNSPDNPDGGTALMEAAKRGDLPLVKRLLDDGADVNAKVKSMVYPCSNGWTALMYASNHSEVVELLLQKGADINARANDGNTALKSAALEGNAEVVKLLLEKGADINSTTQHGNTALRSAAFEGNVDVVKILLERGADANGTGQVFGPLMAASLKGHSSIVELLLNKGADVNATDSQLFTALSYASMESFSDVVKLLVARGADVNVKNDDGDTPLSLAMNNLGRESPLDTISVPMENSSDTNAMTEFVDIPVVDSIESARTSWYQEQILKIVKILLAEGADVNAINNNGDTPLTLAARNNSRAVADLLRDRGSRSE